MHSRLLYKLIKPFTGDIYGHGPSEHLVQASCFAVFRWYIWYRGDRFRIRSGWKPIVASRYECSTLEEFLRQTSFSLYTCSLAHMWKHFVVATSLFVTCQGFSASPATYVVLEFNCPSINAFIVHSFETELHQLPQMKLSLRRSWIPNSSLFGHAE